MKEPMERPKREDYEFSESYQPTSPAKLVHTDWVSYSKALEAYIDHLTAEQGDCPHSPFDWEGRCTICGEQLFTAPQPQELTVREVVEWMKTNKKWLKVHSTGEVETNIASGHFISEDELTKIIKG